jgi:hypothetical protein
MEENVRLRNLESYKTGGSGDRMELSIPLPKTPDGRVYRFSPNENAHPRLFVLGERVEGFTLVEATRPRMKQSPGSPRTVCPYSGVIADDDAFTHPADREAALALVKHAAVSDIDAMLRDTFSGLNRSQPSNSMFSIKLSVTSKPHPKPYFYRKDLLRELVCDHCGRDYGVFAIGLFCPDCGAPNVRLHFGREADLVLRQVEIAEAVEGEELAYRLLGNAHEDVLTAFEATLKAVYLHGILRGGIDRLPRIGNDFQNIERAQARYAELAMDPFSTLTADELDLLRLNIQKRHVIGHNLGVIDEKFAEHSEDARLGETVELVGADIGKFVDLSRVVVDRLDGWLGEFDKQART